MYYVCVNDSNKREILGSGMFRVNVHINMNKDIYGLGWNTAGGTRGEVSRTPNEVWKLSQVSIAFLSVSRAGRRVSSPPQEGGGEFSSALGKLVWKLTKEK